MRRLISITLAGVFYLLVSSAMSFAAAPVEGEVLSADALVKKVLCVAYLSFYQGQDGRAQVTMKITDQQGRTQKRQFTILRRDLKPAHDASPTCGESKYYLYFHRPADVNKTVFMVWKHANRDDDRWMYLPGLDLVKRIAASDDRSSFVGSHFYYEDVAGRGIDEDSHKLIETTDHYYVLKNVAKHPKSDVLSSFTIWLHRQTLIPVKVEYYDQQGHLYRIYEALKVEHIQGYPTVTQARMRDFRTQGETLVTLSSVAYDLGLPETIFTERYLRHAPRRYFR